MADFAQSLGQARRKNPNFWSRPWAEQAPGYSHPQAQPGVDLSGALDALGGMNPMGAGADVGRFAEGLSYYLGEPGSLVDPINSLRAWNAERNAMSVGSQIERATGQNVTELLDPFDIAIGMATEVMQGVEAAKQLGGGRADFESPDAAAQVLDTMMVVGPMGYVSPAPQGSLRTFAGRNARTADQAALRTAQEMAEQGADRRAIWDQTGWFQGVDGQWRFEIDDSAARLSDDLRMPMALDEGLQHQGLYDAYPDMREIPLTETPEGSTALGTYTPDNKLTAEWIALNREGPDLRATALHEGTHAVQAREGFARGGSPGAMADDFAMKRARISALESQAGEYALEAHQKIWNDMVLGRISEAEALAAERALFKQFPALDEAARLTAELGGRSADGITDYRRLAGEVEARNVQTRANMTPEQRRATPPWQTQDVPDADQIVRFGGDGPQASIPRSPFDMGGGGGSPAATGLPPGAAPDRSSMTYLRYRPKTIPERTQRALQALSDPNNPVRRGIDADIEQGATVGRVWYNTEPMRDEFIRRHGEAEGHARWVEFMNLVGAASPGSKVPANIGNASAIRQRMYRPDLAGNMTEGEQYRAALMAVQSLDDARLLGRGRLPGYGHKTQGLQEQIAARQLQGRWMGDPEPGLAASKGSWTENPKPKGFANSLMGNPTNIAADLHWTRAFGMAARDADWFVNGAEISREAADRLLELGPRKLKPYLRTKTVVDETTGAAKESILFDARKALADGKVGVDDLLDHVSAPGMLDSLPRPGEYGAMEDFANQLARAHNMTGPQAQASLWMGAADRTGVDVSSQMSFMDAVWNRAVEQAQKRGTTPEAVLDEFFGGYGLLASGPPSPMGLQGADEEEIREWIEAQEIMRALEGMTPDQRRAVQPSLADAL